MRAKKAAKPKIKAKTPKKIMPKPKPKKKPKPKPRPKPKKPTAPPKPRPTKGAEHAIVFGKTISLTKIKKAASDAARAREYTADDIHTRDYIRDRDYDNLMVRIAILDHIEEQVRTMYPDATVDRKNKLTLSVE